jgi:hypothetical protein
MLSKISLLLPIALSLKVSALSTLTSVNDPTATCLATAMVDKRFDYPGGIVRSVYQLRLKNTEPSPSLSSRG